MITIIVISAVSNTQAQDTQIIDPHTVKTRMDAIANLDANR